MSKFSTWVFTSIVEVGDHGSHRPVLLDPAAEHQWFGAVEIQWFVSQCYGLMGCIMMHPRDNMFLLCWRCYPNLQDQKMSKEWWFLCYKRIHEKQFQFLKIFGQIFQRWLESSTIIWIQKRHYNHPLFFDNCLMLEKRDNFGWMFLMLTFDNVGCLSMIFGGDVKKSIISAFPFFFFFRSKVSSTWHVLRRGVPRCTHFTGWER